MVLTINKRRPGRAADRPTLTRALARLADLYDVLQGADAGPTEAVDNAVEQVLAETSKLLQEWNKINRAAKAN